MQSLSTFLARFAPITSPYIEVDKMIGAKQPGKCTFTASHSGISVTDWIINNEQSKSINRTPLRTEAIRRLLPEDVVALNLAGYRTS